MDERKHNKGELGRTLQIKKEKENITLYRLDLLLPWLGRAPPRARHLR
jgi:hypothetical protein